MRGTSDRDHGQWPLRPADIGVNDIHLFNRLTGSSVEREAKQGEYGSPERKAQNQRLEARAAELNAKFREDRVAEIHARSKADLAARTASVAIGGDPSIPQPPASYGWVFDTRGEPQPVVEAPRELPPEPAARIIPAYGVVRNG